MKNIILLIILIAGVHHNLHSQWDLINEINMMRFAVDGDTIVLSNKHDVYIDYSTNNGLNWFRFDTYKPNDLTQTIAIYGKNIFSGTIGEGLFYSNDFGKTMNKANIKWNNQYVFGFHFIGIFNKMVYAISDFSLGVYRSTDWGENWIMLESFDKIMEIQSMQKNDSIILAKTRMGPYLSLNSGVDWKLIVDPAKMKFEPKAFLLLDTLIFVSYGGNLYQTTDNGENWIIKHDFNLDSIIITELMSCGKYLYATTEKHGVIMSDDFGETWHNSGGFIKNSKTFNILKNDKYIFVGYVDLINYRSGLSRAPHEDCIIVGSETSVEEFPADNSPLHPNPASTSLKISLEGGLRSVAVFNLLGVEVMAKEFSSESGLVTLDISGLSSGVYFVKYHYLGGAERVEKLIIGN